MVREPTIERHADGSRKRRKLANGVLISRGCGQQTARKALDDYFANSVLGFRQINESYEKLMFYVKDFLGTLLTYLRVWVTAKDLNDNCIIHEDRLRETYAEELEELRKHNLRNEKDVDEHPEERQQRLLIDLQRTFLAVCWMDGTPIAKMEERGATNVQFAIPDLFDYGFQFRVCCLSEVGMVLRTICS